MVVKPRTFRFGMVVLKRKKNIILSDNLMIQGLTTIIKDFVTPIKIVCKNKFLNRISKDFLNYFSN